MSATTDKIKNFIAEVPPAAWYVLGGGLLYYTVVRPIMQDVTGSLDPDPGNTQFQQNAPGSVMAQPTQDGTTSPSLPIVSLEGIADILHEAMRSLGTDYDTIKSQLMGLNGKDIQHVYLAFGKKWYDSALGTDGGALFAWAGNKEIDLLGWLYAELDRSERDEIAPIIARSGLTLNASSDAD